MKEGMNKVILAGNLGADAELRRTEGGYPYLHMRVATTDVWFDQERNRQERTDWHTVQVWTKRAEPLSRLLLKGASVVVEGQLRHSSFERDGIKRYFTTVRALDVQIASLPRSRQAPESYEHIELMDSVRTGSAMPPPLPTKAPQAMLSV
jgi:single-strand DNA-binding protein